MQRLEELKEVHPEERISLLKEYIQQLRAMLEQRRTPALEEELRAALEMEIETEDELRVLEEKVETPKVREAELEEKIEQERTLEQLTRQEASEDTIKAIAQRPMAELYNRIHYMQESWKDPTEDQRNEMYMLEKGIQEKARQTQQGDYKPDQKAWHQMTAAEEVIHGMKHGDTYQPHSHYKQ